MCKLAYFQVLKVCVHRCSKSKFSEDKMPITLVNSQILKLLDKYKMRYHREMGGVGFLTTSQHIIKLLNS